MLEASFPPCYSGTPKSAEPDRSMGSGFEV